MFVDWSQNDEHKTTVCVYSLARARAADRLDAGDVDEVAPALGPATTPTGSSSRRATCSSASTQHGDLSRPRPQLVQRLPKL